MSPPASADRGQPDHSLPLDPASRLVLPADHHRSLPLALRKTMSRSRSRSGSASRAIPRDLPVADGEREDDLRPAAGRPHGPRNAVNQSEPGRLSPSREGSRHRVGTADLGGQGPLLRGRAHPHGRWVGHEDGARIEQRQQGAEIPAPGGSQEGGDHFPLPGPRGIRCRGRSLHPAPGPAGELPRRHRGTVNDCADLAERHIEDVVQDEREPLGGSQRVQHHHQRGTDRIGQQRLVLRAGLAGWLEARVKLGRLGRHAPRPAPPAGPGGTPACSGRPGPRPWSATRPDSPPGRRRRG